MRRLRLLQVGLGGWGLDWARGVLPTVETVELKGYVDIAEAARARLSKELDIAATTCFASLEDGLAATDCEAVLVTLPLAHHVAATRQALLAGRHVLVEKPFAPTLAEARDLVELADRQRLTLMVSQNYRYYPAAQLAARLTAGRKLGELSSVAIDFRRHVASAGYRYWELAEPLLSDMAIHHFDMMRFVTGREPVRVACRSWTPPESAFARPTATAALIEMTDGLVVSYRASIDSRGSPTTWGGEWAMEFEKGLVAWTSRGDAGARLDPERLAICPLGGEEAVQDLPKLRHIDRAGTTDAFARAVIEGREPTPFSSGRDNLVSLALSEACIRSAERGGAWVELEDVLPA